MARTPEGARARESTITMRVTEEDRQRITANRFQSGDSSNSSYLRRLIREDIERRNTDQKSA